VHIFSYPLSSIKTSIRFNIVLWLLTFTVFLLDFETEAPIVFICFSYVILGLGGFAIAKSRSNFKKINRKSTQYLSVFFNNTSNAQLLIEGE